MQKVTLRFPCQPGMGSVLLEGLAATLAETRSYDGCHSVEVFVDADNPDNVLLVEEWETRGHQEKYMEWRVSTGMIEMIQPILTAPVESLYLDGRPI